MKTVRLDVLVEQGGRWFVYSEDRSKRLGGPYKTRAEAAKRLQQVEYFKRRMDGLDPVQQRQIVANEVALYRAWAPQRRRRGRRVLPRQRVPKAIAVDYARALRAMLRAAKEAYRPLLEALAAATIRKDADFPAEVKAAAKAPQEFSQRLRIQGREAKRLLDEAERRMASVVSTSEVEVLASKFAAQSSTNQRLQLGKQVRSALGVDPFIREGALAATREDFIAQNVSLIKRIPARLHEKVEGMVMNAVGKSELNVNFAEEIQKQFGIAERHATLIARDQLSKFYGATNRARQQALGVTKFIWRTANDERVRDSHAELEGKEFSWDDLPVNERGEEIYPGSDFQCRCNSEPIFDELQDDVDQAEQGMTAPDHGEPNLPEFGDDLEQDE